MPHRRPEMTLTSRLLAQAMEFGAEWEVRSARFVSLGLLFAMFVLDYLSGPLISLFVGYMVVVSCAAWCLGERIGFLFAFLSAVVSAFVKHCHIVLNPDLVTIDAGVQAWNACGRFLSLAMLVVVVNGMRTALDLERWRADVDGLTGVLTSSAFVARMRGKIDQARNRRQAVVLAYIDLDGFKDVNDRYGHAAGDRVLCDFAVAAVGTIREGDLFARLGGDEFVALLMVASLAEGDRAAEMVHERLTAILGAGGLGVTCSMGALVMDGTDLDTSGGYIELADTLMYEVKHSGKNALRIGRLDPIGAVLRSAFPTPPVPAPDLDALLAQVDHAVSARPPVSTPQSAAAPVSAPAAISARERRSRAA